MKKFVSLFMALLLLSACGKKSSAPTQQPADAAPTDITSTDAASSDSAQTTSQPAPTQAPSLIKLGTYVPHDEAYRYTDSIEISLLEDNVIYLYIETVWHDYVADAYITQELQPSTMPQTQYMIETDYFDSWGNENHLQINFDCTNDALVVDVYGIEANPSAYANAGNSAIYYFSSEDVFQKKPMYENNLYVSYLDDPAYGAYDNPFSGYYDDSYDDYYDPYDDFYSEPYIEPTVTAPPAPTLSSKFDRNYDTAYYDAATGLWVIGNTTSNGRPVKLSRIAHLSRENGYLSFVGCVQNIDSYTVSDVHLNVYLVSETGSIIDYWKYQPILNVRPEMTASIVSTDTFLFMHDSCGDKVLIICDQQGYPCDFRTYYSNSAPDEVYTNDDYFRPGDEALISWHMYFYPTFVYYSTEDEDVGTAECLDIGISYAEYSTPIYGIYITLDDYIVR